MFLRLMLIPLMALLIFGCAIRKTKLELPNTAAYKSNPAYSKALNVLIAAGIITNIKDSPVQDAIPGQSSYTPPPNYTFRRLNLPDPDSLKTSHGLMAAANLGLTAAGVIGTPKGIGMGPALAGGVVWLLTPDEKDPRQISGEHLLSKPLLVAWDVKPDKWFPVWTRAVLAAFKDMDPVYGYKVEIIPEIHVRLKKAKWVAVLTGHEYHEITLRSHPSLGVAKITGGKCDEVQCFYYPDKLRRTTRFFHIAWPLDKAPDFLGGFSPAILIIDDEPSDLVKPVSWLYDNSWIQDPRFPFFELFRKISANLPEKYFIYLPPGISRGPGRGKTDNPVLLHGGREMQFRRETQYLKSL